MLTGMTAENWALVLRIFRALRSRHGAQGQDDRRFLEAMHYYTVNSID